MPGQLVLLRHGQSQWNLENRFTGWVDVDLTDKGRAEARAAGRLLAEEGIHFDVAFTSLLQRAIKTMWLALEELEQDAGARLPARADKGDHVGVPTVRGW